MSSKPTLRATIILAFACVYILSAVGVATVGIIQVGNSNRSIQDALIDSMVEVVRDDIHFGNTTRAKAWLAKSAKSYSNIEYICLTEVNTRLTYIGPTKEPLRSENERSCLKESSNFQTRIVSYRDGTPLATIKVKFLKPLSIGFILTDPNVIIVILLQTMGIFAIAGRIAKAILRDAESVTDDRTETKTTIKEMYLLRQEFLSRKKQTEELQVYRAIGQTTQLLAHDVRKPFSMLKMGLELLSHAEDTQSMRELLRELVPAVNRASSGVDGMISDIMEIGSTSTALIVEPVSPEILVETALNEIFRVYPDSDVSIEYSFEHSHMVNVHAQKIARVFANIVANALQAMNFKGEIWFNTRERAGFIEFCLGNGGSMIPEDAIPQLFEAFFTSGKKGGTGLGLAIAQKVVKAHGGTIWCESSKTTTQPNGQVEFFFTLPSLATHRAEPTELPRHSEEVTIGILALRQQGNRALSSEIVQEDVALEQMIADMTNEVGRAVEVLIVDDEVLYRSALSASLTRTAALSRSISVTHANGSPQALDFIKTKAFDLIISDVDMGKLSLDGFELVRNLRREKGVTSLVCIHSNRMVENDQILAISSGADAFIPKPIARGQLLKLVIQALKRSVPEQRLGDPCVAKVKENSSSVAIHEVATVSPVRYDAVLIDDEVFVRDAWERMARRSKKTVLTLPSSEAFWAVAHGIDTATRIYVDYYLEGENGLEVTEELSKRGFKDMYIATSLLPEEIPPAPWLRGVVGKLPDWTLVRS